MTTDKEKNFISAVLYIYNNQDYIFDFLKELDSVFKEKFEKFEIICVNDSSSDESVKEIKRYVDCSGCNVISILNMSFFQGVELAMNAGIHLAIGDFVCEFDTPILSFDPKLILDIYHHSLSGYDIVAAAPMHGRRFMSKVFYKIFNHYAKTQYLVQTEHFRILSRRGINRVHSISQTIPYRKAVYANCGLKTDVIFYHSKHTPPILDRNTLRKQKETAIDAIILYTNIAYLSAIGLAAIMMFFTVFIGMYALFVYWNGKPVEGWTTTMLFLAFAFLGIFAILAIIIKYMSIILNLNFSKQKYMIESIEKLNSERHIL